MNKVQLYNNVNKPQGFAAVLKDAESFVKSNPTYGWKPFGDNDGNKGIITHTSHAGRALIERFVNVFDSYSEKYVEEHPEAAVATSVQDLVQNHMGKNLGTMTVAERLAFAKEIGCFQRHTIYNGKLVKRGEKKPTCSKKNKEECISITDTAQGMTALEMVATGILALHSSNKRGKDWLQGQYGQGGASSLSHCKATLIASRKQGDDNINFTVIKKQVASEEYPASLWVMLVNLETGLPVVINKNDVEDAIDCGTKITHFKYSSKDIEDNSSKEGSPFHLFRRLLPNCEFALYFDDCGPSKGKGSTRVLYGAGKGLEVKKIAKRADERAKILHPGKFHSLSIDDGFIDVRVTVLDNKLPPIYKKQTTAEKNNKVPKVITGYKKPVSRVGDFFSVGKTLVYMVNGQNQGEGNMGSIIFKKFPLLKANMIVEVSIDRLSIEQKDDLEVSTREMLKEGDLLDEINKEIEIYLRGIPQLASLQDKFEKAASINTVKDESGLDMLKNLGIFGQIGAGMAGENIGNTKLGKPADDGMVRIKKTGHTPVDRVPPKEYILMDTPTFIEFQHEGVLPIYINDKKQYAWCSTDAKDYFDESITVSVSGNNGVTAEKYGKLSNGSFRINIDGTNAKLDDTGVITVTLTDREGTKHVDRTVYMVSEATAKKERAKGKGRAAAIADIPEPSVNFVAVHWGDAAESIIVGEKKGDLTTIAGHAMYKEEDNSIKIWYSVEYAYYYGCLKAAGGKRVQAEFESIIQKYLSALAIADIVDQYSDKETTTDIKVDWNTAVKAACFIATEHLKK